VRSLVLLDSAGPDQASLDAGQDRLSGRILELMGTGVVDGTVQADGDDCAPSVTAIAPAYFADPAVGKAGGLGGASCSQHTFQTTLAANHGYDLRAQAAKLTMPTLVVAGAADPFGRAMVADDLVAALKGAKPTLVLLPACGHLPFVECPAPFFAELRGFLAARP
jgi:pimeloyl-ACP methyl ester carboxylesterase